MRQLCLGLVLVASYAGVWMSVPAAAQAEHSGLTPGLLLSAPGRYLNRPVEVVIVEPLVGPATARALALLEYGQVRVRVPDGGPQELSLVPAAFRLNDPDRYTRKFDRPLVSPIKVRGELLLDEELSQRRKSYVIRVASYEVLPPPVPRPVKSLAEIDADPASWDRRRIVYEGTYETQFEVSALDRRIWLGFAPSTERVNPPSERNGRHQVRVTGYLYAKPGARYGHLGGYAYELIADTIEFR